MGGDNTQKILNVLADYGVKATFFVVGNWADQYPEQAKAIAAAQTSMMPYVIAGLIYWVFNFVVVMVLNRVEKRMNYYHD